MGPENACEFIVTLSLGKINCFYMTTVSEKVKGDKTLRVVAKRHTTTSYTKEKICCPFTTVKINFLRFL